MEKVQEQIEDYVGSRGFALIFALAAFFLFLSYIGSVRNTSTLFTVSGANLDVATSIYGYPFEMIAFLYPSTGQEGAMAEISRVQILWGGLILNFLLFGTIAFAIVYSTRRFILNRILP